MIGFIVRLFTNFEWNKNFLIVNWDENSQTKVLILHPATYKNEAQSIFFLFFFFFAKSNMNANQITQIRSITSWLSWMMEDEKSGYMMLWMSEEIELLDQFLKNTTITLIDDTISNVDIKFQYSMSRIATIYHPQSHKGIGTNCLYLYLTNSFVMSLHT
jgi:hypothetical protein